MTAHTRLSRVLDDPTMNRLPPHPAGAGGSDDYSGSE